MWQRYFQVANFGESLCHIYNNNYSDKPRRFSPACLFERNFYFFSGGLAGFSELDFSSVGFSVTGFASAFGLDSVFGFSDGFSVALTSGFFFSVLAGVSLGVSVLFSSVLIFGSFNFVFGCAGAGKQPDNHELSLEKQNSVFCFDSARTTWAYFD